MMQRGVSAPHLVASYDVCDDMFRSDRKSTRLNSSHDQISYAVFCLKKKKNQHGVEDGDLVLSQGTPLQHRLLEGDLTVERSHATPRAGVVDLVYTAHLSACMGNEHG